MSKRSFHKRLLDQSGGGCFYCGVPLSPYASHSDVPQHLYDRGLHGPLIGGRMHFKASLEHILPKSQGGFRNDQDCVAACIPCNELRGDLPLRDFFTMMLGPPNL